MTQPVPRNTTAFMTALLLSLLTVILIGDTLEAFKAHHWFLLLLNGTLLIFARSYAWAYWRRWYAEYRAADNPAEDRD